jgi:hypothetical protein
VALINIFDFAILERVGTVTEKEWTRKLRRVAKMNPEVGERLKERDETAVYEVWIIDKRSKVVWWLGLLMGYEVLYPVVTTYLNSNPESKVEVVWEPL